MLLALNVERKLSRTSTLGFRGKSELKRVVRVPRSHAACADGIRAPRITCSHARVKDRRDWTYGEGAVQRDEELLKCVVSFMGMYHRSLPGKVSHHGRVSVGVMGGGDGVIGPRAPNAWRHTHLKGEEDGKTGPEQA